jgi:hypothetical protein
MYSEYNQDKIPRELKTILNTLGTDKKNEDLYDWLLRLWVDYQVLVKAPAPDYRPAEMPPITVTLDTKKG